jgi:hypothetical protein
MARLAITKQSSAGSNGLREAGLLLPGSCFFGILQLSMIDNMRSQVLTGSGVQHV